MWLRNIAIIGQIIAIGLAMFALDIQLNANPLWVIIGVLICLNLATFWRIKSLADVTNKEFLLQIMLDISALFGLLYFAGGANNPFTSLFILQVVIASIVLRPAQTWCISILTVALYTTLLFYHQPIPYFIHHHVGGFFYFHVWGMWISFVLLAIIIPFFVVRMNQTIHKKTILLMEAEKMAAVGSLAANAAHELGTPLGTLAILSENLEPKKYAEFSTHISRCKSIISRITQNAGVGRAEAGSKKRLQLFLEDTASEWQSTHDNVRFKVNIQQGNSPYIIAEESLKQAFFCLLYNAKEAAAHTIAMHASWQKKTLTVTISDDGTGIPHQIEKEIGTIGLSSKKNGMGLGVFLAKNSISRLGGTLEIVTKQHQGTNVTATIPLENISLI